MYYYTNNYFSRNNTSYSRILHASPDAPGMDIYLNNTLIGRNLTYRNFTEYIPLMSGRYRLDIFPTGTTSNPVISRDIDVIPDTDTTIAIKGLLEDIDFLIVNDTAARIPSNMAEIKFVHLIPDAPRVDVTLPDGRKLFENIAFNEVSEKSTIEPGRYTVQLRVAGTDNIILTVPNVVLNSGRYYTIYGVGTMNGAKPLQALIALDKASY
ncbi:DUF4397 domain-containing protein [Clostridium sp. D2Q-14]|uniref:DUF4397 domain-containing protein n=1 Tax=Anaeromonas gelatinilytica TaxID=2683194 RepID=UPI00193C5CD9|nr:DUF4397 domain-containing protein [Anaeromonas gelatinilytica]MBS4534297.1 DUF4397 domain-containing protein [Anaeromonas gelatinilytica]